MTTLAIPQPVLATLCRVEGHAYGVCRAAEDAGDRLETRRIVDLRSDLHFARAYRTVEQFLLDRPRYWPELGSVLRDLRDGLELDGIEDEHCDAAATSVGACDAEGRAIAALVEATVRCIVCGRAGSACRCGEEAA